MQLCMYVWVPHLASIVLDTKTAMRQAVVCEELWVFTQAALKVLMFSTNSVQLVQEGLICHGPGPQTLLIKHGQDPILVLMVIKQIIDQLKFKIACSVNDVIHQKALSEWRIVCSYELTHHHILNMIYNFGVKTWSQHHKKWTKKVFLFKINYSLTYIFNEVTDDGIIEILNVGPFNAL